MKISDRNDLLQWKQRIKGKKLVLLSCILFFFCGPAFVVSAQSIEKSSPGQQVQIAPQIIENLRQKISNSRNSQLKKRWKNLDLTRKKTYQDVAVLADLMELDQKELFQK